jgi:hypothetical protein
VEDGKWKVKNEEKCSINDSNYIPENNKLEIRTVIFPKPTGTENIM